MLACARIGAVHSVCFGGFSPESLAGRIADCGARIVITADEGVRGGKRIPLKANVDAACALSGAAIERVIVVARTGADIAVASAARHPLGGRARRAVPRLPGRADGRRGPLVHPLHLGIDRKAQGRGPHHRRLCDLCRDDLRLGVRRARGRHLLVHRRRRLDHRAQLHRLWRAAQRRDDGDVRRRPQLPRRRAHVGDVRPARRDDLLHRADRDPRARARGRRLRHARTSAARCACSARSASRSIPRRGNGIGASSATSACRSSTPGGRPRPAGS